MSGGGFNRIIGISRKVPKPDGSEQYILRIPRFDDHAANLVRDVAALRFVSQLGGIPIPEIVYFDETTDKKLGQPYMVQNRLPGTNLYSTYPTLDADAKYQIASELGHVFQRMLSAKNLTAGLFGPPSDLNSFETSNRNIVISSLFEPETLEPGCTALSLVYDGTLDLLDTNLNARNADGMKNLSADTLRHRSTMQFIAMASELDANGWFKDIPFSLCHQDLAPHNTSSFLLAELTFW
jgi:hypothetical protein